jgi:hypothetical protein
MAKAKAKTKSAAKAPAKTQKKPPAKAEKKSPPPAPAPAAAPQDWSDAIRKAVEDKKQPRQFPGGGDSWKRKPRP